MRKDGVLPDRCVRCNALLVVSILIFMGDLLFAVAISRPVTPARIDDQYVWLRKIHPEYLADLPWKPIDR